MPLHHSPTGPSEPEQAQAQGPAQEPIQILDQCQLYPPSPSVHNTNDGVPSFCTICNEVKIEKTPIMMISTCNHSFH